MIRQMRREDIGQVYRIACSSLDQYYVPETFEFFLAQWPRGQLVACDPTGRIFGFLSGATLGGGRCTISLFAVESRCRNSGAGGQLLSEFRMAAVMQGCGTIQLEVRDKNTHAIQFYEKRGFMKTEFLSDFYTDHGNAVRMIASSYQNS